MTEYQKGYQKGISYKTNLLYMKNHKLSSKMYKAGINNQRRLREFFNIPHSIEYNRRYDEGIREFNM